VFSLREPVASDQRGGLLLVAKKQKTGADVVSVAIQASRKMTTRSHYPGSAAKLVDGTTMTLTGKSCSTNDEAIRLIIQVCCFQTQTLAVALSGCVNFAIDFDGSGVNGGERSDCICWVPANDLDPGEVLLRPGTVWVGQRETGGSSPNVEPNYELADPRFHA
jgi:hypothetical protein